MNEDMQIPSDGTMPEMPSGGGNGMTPGGGNVTMPGGEIPDMSAVPEGGGMMPPNGEAPSTEDNQAQPEMNTTKESDASDGTEGTEFEQEISGMNSMGNGSFPGRTEDNRTNRGEMTEQIQMPDMGNMGQFGGTAAMQSGTNSADLLLLGVSIGILIIGIVIAALFKKR